VLKAVFNIVFQAVSNDERQEINSEYKHCLCIISNECVQGKVLNVRNKAKTGKIQCIKVNRQMSAPSTDSKDMWTSDVSDEDLHKVIYDE